VIEYQIVGGSEHEQSLDVVVGADCRFFEGHFPGRPILPAVAQLALVEELLRRTIGRTVRIVALDRLRMLQPVEPGERLSLRLRAGTDPTTARFEIDRGPTRISDGIVGWTAGEA